MQHDEQRSIKKVKNIAAIIYMIVLVFLVGGSYINQQRDKALSPSATEAVKP
jgi:hypothetical protein